MMDGWGNERANEQINNYAKNHLGLQKIFFEEKEDLSSNS